MSKVTDRLDRTIERLTERRSVIAKREETLAKLHGKRPKLRLTYIADGRRA